MKSIKVIVPGKPQGKARPRVTKAGHAFTPEKTREYEAWIRENFRNQNRLMEPFEADIPLMVNITAHFKPPKSWSKAETQKALNAVYHLGKPDCDNIAKCIDAINGLAWTDDKQVAVLKVRKIWDFDEYLEIEIRDLML